MLKALLADDELDAINLLINTLTICCSSVKIIGVSNNVQDTEKKIKELQPDVVFLDIQMPGGNVFEMLNRLKPLSFDIVFVTAYDKYAVEAFKHSAVDYILKPFDINDIKEAVLKLEQKHNTRLDINDKIAQLVEEFLGQSSKIMITTIDKTLYIKLCDIIRIESDGNFIHIITTTGEKHIVSKRLKTFSEILDNKRFYRVHNSFIINLHHVKAFINKENSVIMSDNKVIPVSRNKKEELLKLLATL